MATFPFRTELPFNLQDVRDEFDRLLDRVWHVGLNTAPLDGQDWAPAMDIVDEGSSYRIRMEVAGIAADQIDVSVLENSLVVRGYKPVPPKPAEGQRKLRGECRYGNFCRRFEFPMPVSEDAIAASCKNGVLEVSVPKKSEAKGRSVKVQAED
ncbi:MAG TPA: Hsp20/alpha crystallin family protein [Phycisphaerae bacterium]|nr:Hsp20/alpha crystallin family protein [Phycisphaerae bacterium]